MPERDDRPEGPPTFEPAQTPSIVEEFGIEGLHGFRSISWKSPYAASILIAKNGSGKTTLLSALNAFLKGQFFRLRDLEFDYVYCKLRGVEHMLTLRKTDLDDALQFQSNSPLGLLASKIQVDPITLFQFLTEECVNDRGRIEFSSEHPIASALLREFNYNSQRVNKLLLDADNTLYNNNTDVHRLYAECKSLLTGFEILYLPTYRRVELALRTPVESPRTRRRRPAIDLGTSGLFTGDIQFGLSDIPARLSQINERIVLESNHQYRQISADIITALLDESFEESDASTGAIPNREDLKLFFSRLEGGRRLGAFYPVAPPDFDKIYSPDRNLAASGKFLKFFLSQLNKVIESTKEVEGRVEQFVEFCNRYLSADDVFERDIPSSDIGSRSGKRLDLNRENFQVRVVAFPGDKEVSLDALSSGEKQMISLFAKLFLYESKKIVLIDEPELSLSIDWQRQILVDVLRSPLCAQLIAITHSPFVFDNELDPYAGSLITRLVAPDPPTDLFPSEPM